MTSQPYFIYLDTKIIGAAKQIITFFENGVFPVENTTILIKKYKHKSAKLIEKLFRKSELMYRFVNAANIDALSQGIVFYPFNAQSNCRVVANRNLKHIFITHGESNKISSIKPIIRIYDYVITAGKAGIDRFLKHKIFSQYDVDSGRLITMGDTFVGRTGLSSEKAEPVIFYAPTWEGGIEQENYSSLSHVNQVVNTIWQLSQYHQIQHIVIRPHPNTGHRLPAYNDFLLDISEALLMKSLKVTLFKPHLSFSFSKNWRLRRKGAAFKSTLSEFKAVVGLCDISAIETQLLNENIAYYLFCSSEHKDYLKALRTEYNDLAIDFKSDHLLSNFEYKKENYIHLKDYMIDSQYSGMKLSARIECLLTHLNH